MRLTLTALAALSLLGPVWGQADLAIEETPRGWEVYRDGQTVIGYTSDDEVPKPWIDPFLTPAGHNVVLTSPADHIHHRGLMLAWGNVGIEGEPADYHLVFWGEEGDPHSLGRIVPDPERPARLSTGNGKATITADYLWLRNSDDLLVLRERRTITVEPPMDDRASVVTWVSEQTPEMDITIGPTPGLPVSYYGLGIRCAPDMDLGSFVNSNGRRGVEGCHGDRAEWCAYQGPSDPIRGFALFDHPDNPRYPTGWFAMNSFGYLTASLPAFGEYPLGEGETLTLRYGAVAFDGAADEAMLDSLYEAWLAENPARADRVGAMTAEAWGVFVDDELVFSPLLPATAMKPAYHPLATPLGTVVTDPTHPQPHHHGLWLTWGKVLAGGDAIDFWAEGGPPAATGRVSTESLSRTERRGGVTYESIHLWGRASGGDPLLRESRRVTVHTGVPEATLVTFQTRQTARRDLVLSAESNEAISYYGLCLQMPGDMNHGLVVNSRGSRGGADVVGEGATWCAYSTDVRPARTVVLMDHPDNPRHPATYFTLPTGFFSMGLVSTEDYPMAAGDTLALTYGIAAFDGEFDAEIVDNLYQQWLQLQ
jgi:hypothetical protein